MCCSVRASNLSRCVPEHGLAAATASSMSRDDKLKEKQHNIKGWQKFRLCLCTRQLQNHMRACLLPPPTPSKAVAVLSCTTCSSAGCTLLPKQT